MSLYISDTRTYFSIVFVGFSEARESPNRDPILAVETDDTFRIFDVLLDWSDDKAQLGRETLDYDSSTFVLNLEMLHVARTARSTLKLTFSSSAFFLNPLNSDDTILNPRCSNPNALVVVVVLRITQAYTFNIIICLF